MKTFTIKFIIVLKCKRKKQYQLIEANHEIFINLYLYEIMQNTLSKYVCCYVGVMRIEKCVKNDKNF